MRRTGCTPIDIDTVNWKITRLRQVSNPRHRAKAKRGLLVLMTLIMTLAFMPIQSDAAKKVKLSKSTLSLYVGNQKERQLYRYCKSRRSQICL